MKTRAFRFTSKADGLELHAVRWGAPDGAKAQVLISHGAGEHMARYTRFAQALTAAGYLVYGADHRGHGKTIPQGGTPGDFGAAGWPALVEDVLQLGALAKEENPDLPLIVFGHSLGSWAAQQAAARASDLMAGLVLSGSAAQDKLAEARMANPDEGFSLASVGGADTPARTPFDWLSRDEAEVDKYIADPLCGFDIQTDSLMSGLEAAFEVAKPDVLASLRKDLPVLFIAGTHDPINGDMVWLDVLEERWRAAGLTIDTHYYEGARHELLNETNRDEVTARVMAWMDGVL